jgi:hypothetical protein
MSDEAKKQIDEKLALLHKTLKEAQELADKHNLSFRVHLSLPEGNTGEGHGSYPEYHYTTLGATYHGKESEPQEIYDKDTNKYSDGMNKEGYWYWHASAMNC